MIRPRGDMARIGIMSLWAKWRKDRIIRILWLSTMVGPANSTPSPRIGIGHPRILICPRIRRIRISRKSTCRDLIVGIRVGIEIDIECAYYRLH